MNIDFTDTTPTGRATCPCGCGLPALQVAAEAILDPDPVAELAAIEHRALQVAHAITRASWLLGRLAHATRAFVAALRDESSSDAWLEADR